MIDPEGRGRSDTPSRPVLASPEQILATFTRARPSSVSEVAARAVNGTVVKLSGRAAPGPGGPLRAPLSGAECVWYRSVVSRHLRHTQTNPVPPPRPLPAAAPSDLPVRTDRTVSGQPMGTDVSSIAPFTVRDGESAVVVDPAGADIDTNVFAVNAVVRHQENPAEHGGRGPGSPFGPDDVHTEWIIPVGAELLAVGVVRRGADGVPELVSQGEDIALVSTKPEQQVLARRRAASDVHIPAINPRRVAGITAGIFLAVTVIVVVVVLLVVLG